MLQFVALKLVLRKKNGFADRTFSFLPFPNQQIDQVNSVYFNLIINLVETMSLQLNVA